MLMDIVRKLLLRKDHLTGKIPLSRTDRCLWKSYAQVRYLFKMDDAIVRHDENSDVFRISFVYVDQDVNLKRQFNFVRKVDETINKFLEKIDSGIEKHVAIKQRRKSKFVSSKQDNIQNNKVDEPVIPKEDNVQSNKIKILKNNSILDGNLPCKLILEDPENFKLVIFHTEYALKVNTPYVTNITLPLSILANFPVYPSKFESLYTDQAKSVFNWYKTDLRSKQAQKWIQVGEDYLYVPDSSDIGCRLKLTCVPRNDVQTGPTVEVTSDGTVQAGPGRCPFDERHAFCKTKLSGKSFRILSYNVLADVYAETNYSKQVLYPYCPVYALSMDYRKLLILKELIGFNADIICLQEVDTVVFKTDLMPAMAMLNYDGVHNPKRNLKEGLAMFYNRERFEKLSSHYSVISEGTNSPEFSTVWSQIQNEKTKTRFVDRNTIIQAMILRSKENQSEIVVVGNLHLYFQPDADHIRLLQAYYAITYLQNLVKEVKRKHPECNTSIILCGDFNSVPECGIYQLMTQNYVPESCPDWKSNSEESVENVFLKQDTKLSSACGTPEYTNHTACFTGCLDYIFYQQDFLQVQQVVPLPSTEVLKLHTGLPSVVSPSDHISLCADLNWTK